MVTKYDVFELVYKNRNPIKPIEIVKEFGKGKSSYNIIHRFLGRLVKENLLVKTKNGFQGKVSPKATQLHWIIQFCIHNNINYNLLLEKKLVDFLDLALRKGEITAKDSKLNARTMQKYVDFLSEKGMLLELSRKPLKVKIFYNTLVKNLLMFFNLKPKCKEIKIDYLDKIAQELRKFKRLRSGDEQGYRRILDNLKVSFIHHSLSLEGNPVTLADTFKILKQKVIPKNLRTEDVDEIKNYQKALMEMIEDSLAGELLTVQTVLRYHQTAMSHDFKVAGKIRDYGVHIKNNPQFKIAPCKEIEGKLARLFEKYETFMEKKHSLKEVLEFAAYFHNEFQHIHPFGDGNSRITRLLMIHILQAQGIPFLDIPFGLLDEYMLNTKKYVARSDSGLSKHLQKIILFNLKLVNAKLQ